MAGGKKVVVVGDERTGKTALCLVYCRAPFPATHFTTVSDTYSRSGCTLELADTAGSYEFDRLRPFSYDNADAFIIAFAVDDPLSLENVEEKWVPEVRYFSAKVPILLVALKTDLRSDQETAQRLSRESLRPVRFDEGEAVAARIGAAKYIECSARDSINVDAVFDAARAILGAGDAELTGRPTVSVEGGARGKRRSSLSLQTPSTAEALDAGGPQTDEMMAGPSTPDSETSRPAPSSSESSDSDDDGHQSESPASPMPRVLPRRTSLGGRSIATASIATANNDDDAATRRKSIKSIRSAHSAASQRSTKPSSSIKQKSPSIVVAPPPPVPTPPLKGEEPKIPEPSKPQVPQPTTATKQRSGGCKCIVM
ncbi:hypothetical protein HDU89_008038 [Geranomyces variabilis]|nr:hypothetical protein HDU89_008038 [Geranomyces variabilis]